MDVKLNFDVHVQNKISNAIKLLEILYVIMKCYIKLYVILLQDVLLTLYKVLIRSHLHYADIILTNLIMSCFIKKLKRSI